MSSIIYIVVIAVIAVISNWNKNKGKSARAAACLPLAAGAKAIRCAAPVLPPGQRIADALNGRAADFRSPAGAGGFGPA